MGIVKSSGSKPPISLLAERSEKLLQSQSVASAGLLDDNEEQKPAFVDHAQTKIMFGRADDQLQSVESDFFTITLEQSKPSSFLVPDSPIFDKKQRWVPVGETIEVAGEKIRGGMLYVGRRCVSEPSRINLKLEVSELSVDISAHPIARRSSYGRLSPKERRAYLQWLSGGREDPCAGIGFVYLFFYGLEYRVLVDAKKDPVAAADVLAIISEIERLREVYHGSRIFNRDAGRLLRFLAATCIGPERYLGAPPLIKKRTYEKCAELCIGLGQLAAKEIPIPADWALAWVLANWDIEKPAAVARYRETFSSLFKAEYEQLYGEGFIIPSCKKRLEYDYVAISPVMGWRIVEWSSGLPDVMDMLEPRKKLQLVVDKCVAEYGRCEIYYERNPSKPDAADKLLQLPVSLWPKSTRRRINDLKHRVDEGMLVMNVGELSDSMGIDCCLSRSKFVGVVRALEFLGVGVEHSLLFSKKTPKADDVVSLFSIKPEDGPLQISIMYRAAAAILDFSFVIVLADGGLSPRKTILLSRFIDFWSNLGGAQYKRLKARFSLLLGQNVSVQGLKNNLQLACGITVPCLKKSLEPLTSEIKRAVAELLTDMAQTDGEVSLKKLNLLEQLYTALKLDRQLLYSHLHVSASGRPVGVSVYGKSFQAITQSASTIQSGFALDFERIAQLQRETEQVFALLAHVFVDDSAEEPAAEDVTPSEGAVGIYGLDAGHSAFLKLLISRPEWNREDLEAMAGDMDIMLDGALELINDMAFEHFDMPVTEGEDPFEINPDIMEKLPL
jgi:hypothetical protein